MTALTTNKEFLYTYVPSDDEISQVFEDPAQDIWCAFDSLCLGIHAANVRAGWWEQSRNYGELISLVHSELSESLEADRKGLADDHLPHFAGREVELVDAIIRLTDMLGAILTERLADTDVEAEMALENVRRMFPGEILRQKIVYNRQRGDHKPENRQKEGGKAY